MFCLLFFCVIVGLSTCQHPPGPPPDPQFQPQPWEQYEQEREYEEHPAVRTPDEHEEFSENDLPTNDEAIVGAGLPGVFPLLGLATAGAKIKGATALAIAEAHTLALKHKAEMDKYLIDAKLRQDLMASQARLAGHKLLFKSAILGTADRSAGPEDTPEAIKRDIAEDMAGVSSGNTHPLPQMINRLNDMFPKPAVKREIPSQLGFYGPNRKRDENLYLWSLNNGGLQDTHLRQEFPEQQIPINQPDSLPGLPEMEQGRPEVDMDQFEDDEVLTPVDEMEGNQVPEHGDFARMNERANPRHFGFHHHHFGIHGGQDGFHSGAYGSSAPGLDGLGHFGKFGRPTEVTINNQQNTFTNAVPTSSGNANFQISQTTGSAGSSQSHSASNQGNPHSGSHGFRQANEEQRTPVLKSERPQEQMQMIKQNMRMTITDPTAANPMQVNHENQKSVPTPQMHMVDHFLGMRSLMPANSGSNMAMTMQNQMDQ